MSILSTVWESQLSRCEPESGEPEHSSASERWIANILEYIYNIYILYTYTIVYWTTQKMTKRIDPQIDSKTSKWFKSEIIHGFRSRPGLGPKKGEANTSPAPSSGKLFYSPAEVFKQSNWRVTVSRAKIQPRQNSCSEHRGCSIRHIYCGPSISSACFGVLGWPLGPWVHGSARDPRCLMRDRYPWQRVLKTKRPLQNPSADPVRVGSTKVKTQGNYGKR